MKKIAAFLLSLVATVALGQAGTGVEGPGVEGPGVECGHVYGPPCAGSSTFRITTEAGVSIITESGQMLVTQAAP